MSGEIFGFSPNRIGAMLRRHAYLLSGSWMRIIDIIYWPAVQMIMWGFLTQFLAGKTSYVAQAIGILLAGLMLWDSLFRVQLSVAISFLEEMWSRNLGNLFVSPLRPSEFAASVLLMGVIRTLLGMIPVSLMAWLFFDFSIYSMGFALAGFFANLTLFGWAIGIAVCGLVMRYGLGAENIAWAAAFLFLPVAAVYYPVTVLPGWLQAVAWSLPPAYVFEGMRAVLIDGTFRTDLMLGALALNLVYLGLGFAAFLGWFEASRRRGQLLGQGE
ncbi:MAG: ABC transporter permease [Ferrovibrio sp.]|jgi:ABC-2 type transport system permease protein|uniref:ABC transporter permease n=1 Tax=Ferrovibrio sp. TaxID=1917215 RepID=UPI0039187A7C